MEQQEFLRFLLLTAEKKRKVLLTSFDHQRFNTVFYNAGCVIHQLPDMVDYLTRLSDKNQLLESVLADLQDEIIVSEVRALAIFGKIVTGQFYKLIESSSVAKHILQLNPYFR